jgi:hypothetical protein
MLVEEKHRDLRCIEQFVDLRSAIPLGRLRETGVAGLTDPMSLVDKKEIELQVMGIAHVQTTS